MGKLEASFTPEYHLPDWVLASVQEMVIDHDIQETQSGEYVIRQVTEEDELKPSSIEVLRRVAEVRL